MLWLQPGAEDASVIKEIEDAGLADRCIYRTQSIVAQDDSGSGEDGPVCPPGINMLKEVKNAFTHNSAPNTNNDDPCVLKEMGKRAANGLKNAVKRA